MASVVQTIKDRCRRCYHCVRNCPARAIRVVEGQATVVEERCIACGNCFRVCAQKAKQIEDATPDVRSFLEAGGEVVAALAPSFPAAFPPWRPGQVVAALRRLGFTRVVEVAFGADLVARRYAELVSKGSDGPLLASPCPALTGYVEKYACDLLPYLAPVVSPMIALGRAVKQKHWPGAKVVFIGPCTAKKKEAREPEVAGAVDSVLTYDGLHTMLTEAGVDPAAEEDSDFDPPHAALGRVFPLTGGLLRAAAIEQNVLDKDIVVTDGTERVLQLLEELQHGAIDAHFLDILFCEGCIGGPVMSTSQGEFGRREAVVTYVQRQPRMTPQETEAYLGSYDDVDLSRGFHADPVDPPLPTEEELRAVLDRENKFKPEDELNCGACGYATCREKAIAVCRGLADVGMCLPYLIDESDRALTSLARSHAELAQAQERLGQAEKLAAMGRLAAGVAHQVNNPLATVLLYSHMLLRDLPQGDSRAEDLETIVAETTRCKNIVTELLNFARENQVNAEPVDLNALLEGILEIAEKGTAEGVALVRHFAPGLPPVLADPDQLTQAFRNILENSYDAMPGGGTVEVTTSLVNEDSVRVEISDAGPGIPPEVLGHIFEPFFTTKPMGQGTGLGLALADGIVKLHRGQIRASNRPGGGATFTITIPLQGPAEAPGGDLIG